MPLKDNTSVPKKRGKLRIVSKSCEDLYKELFCLDGTHTLCFNTQGNMNKDNLMN